ncbi:glycoside hydrolase family 43 protein [Hyaloscypha variabilis F]|uniref:Glycoside hydrolase family 43 protein n=1 Tax=Hyaloscypha variabilis (strain UAMH 11265 / GT02V1 / F) TaxID=1149755 RepID=A0A2J6R8W1_HYAVF|nr:glycoside hydrolase family 43 protein [Hyaloscypha variabilis F]
MTSKYSNPIIPGFSPDPSVCFHDGTFFLVNSSFHMFPGVPIYASKDLNSWTQIGNAIHRTSQLDLTKATSEKFPIGPQKILIATGGRFAATIRQHNGTFYIICTNDWGGGPNLTMRNFYVTTKDIWSGEWSDPIWFDFSGIDPSLFFDDDGKVYIQGSFRPSNLMELKCDIRQFEVEIQTGTALSETKKIWDGFAGKDDAEGPHIYKKDGWYYLLTAEAATFEHHMVAMARSLDIWGPYESYESNPVLTAYGKGDVIQNTGHGDLFQDGDGKWWIAALGIRNMDGCYPMGRETFLAPWNGRLEAGHRLSSRMETKRYDYLYIRTPNLEDYSFSSNNRVIKLVPRKTTLSSATGTTAFLGKRQRLQDCTATVTLKTSAKESTTFAGLTIWKEPIRHEEIYYDYSTSSVCFSKTNKMLSDEPVTKSHQLKLTDTIHFQIKATPKVFDLSYKVGSDDKWTKLGSMDAIEFSGYDFTGTIFGIFASSKSEEAGAEVTFEEFKIT